MFDHLLRRDRKAGLLTVIKQRLLRGWYLSPRMKTIFVAASVGAVVTAPVFLGGRFGQGNSSTVNGTTMNNFTYPLTNKVAPGGSVFFAMHTDVANSLSSIGDNINGPWSTTPDKSVSGTNQTLAIYKFTNSAASDPTNGTGLAVTIKFTGNVNPPITWLQSWSGIKASSAFDNGSTAASLSLTGNGNISAGSFTVAANTLILTFASVDNFAGSNPALSKIAALTGTLQSAGIDWPVGGGTAPKASSYQIKTTGGSINPGFTLTGNNAADKWNVLSVSYLIDLSQGAVPTGAYVASYDFHFVTVAPNPWTVQSPLQSGEFPIIIGNNDLASSVTDSQGNSWTLDPGDASPPSDTVGQVWYPPKAGLTTPDDNYRILIHNASAAAQSHFGVLHCIGLKGTIGKTAFQTAPIAGAVVQHDPDIGGAGGSSLTLGSIVVLAGPAGTGPVLGLSNPISAVLMSAFIQSNNDDGNTENSGDGWGFFTVTPALVGVTVNVSWQMGTSFTGKIDNGAGSAGTTLTVSGPVTGPLIGIGTSASTLALVGGTPTAPTANTFISAFGTGTGGVGTYTVSPSQLTPASGTEAMTSGQVGGGPQAHAVEFLAA